MNQVVIRDMKGNEISRSKPMIYPEAEALYNKLSAYKKNQKRRVCIAHAV